MGLLESIILGIIQGLTEFLPVSSSGHLELAKVILGQDLGEEGLLMTVTLHAATALSTLVIFRKDVADILRGLLQFKRNEETLFSLKIILSMIPAAFIGLYYNDAIEALFNGNLLLVGGMLIITGILLFLADRAKRTEKRVSFSNAFIIGVAQAIAILPGISRSGATISTSVLLGVDRGKAARFSFLMVVPLILGKMAKDILDGEFGSEAIDMVSLGAGFFAAFITGLIACTWMITLVKRSKLSWFAIYCIFVGVVAMVWSMA
jgi:undecaprenyl-diphosphatase